MLCCRVQNLLSAYCDRELTGAEMLAVQRHLHGCASCQNEHRSVVRIKHLLGSLGEVEPPRRFTPALLQARRSPALLRAALRLLRSSGLPGNIRERWIETVARARDLRTFHGAAVVGMVAVTVLAMALFRQPQSPDAVRAHVPEAIAADESRPLSPDATLVSRVFRADAVLPPPYPGAVEQEGAMLVSGRAFPGPRHPNLRLEPGVWLPSGSSWGKVDSR